MRWVGAPAQCERRAAQPRHDRVRSIFRARALTAPRARGSEPTQVRLLAGVAHEHICEYYESFVDNNKLCIVMEYCPCGDLSRYVRRRKQQARPLAENTIWSYFMQMAMAVQHLHKAKVLHRDVKLANVMRKTAEVVKLGDLGVARLLKGRLATTQIGTPHYMPPEVWKNRPYSFSSDAWALGVCLYEMCTFGVPFEARSLPELRQKVMRASYAPISSSYSSDLSRVIRALLDPEPSTRPTVADVLRMSCIRRCVRAIEARCPLWGCRVTVTVSVRHASPERS